MTKKRIKLFDCSRSKKDLSQLLPLFKKGHLASGSEVNTLERKLSRFLGINNVLTFSDMTNALALLMRVIGVEKGDEILCCSFNCLSSTSAIDNVGAKTVWVDIKDDYPEMCIQDCENKITKKTKAILLYHAAGYPSRAKDFKKLCRKYNLILIEDANNSLGATTEGDLVGTIGDFSLFSFYPNRQVASIEGAAIAFRNSKFRLDLERLRKYGINQSNFRNNIGEINTRSNVYSLSLNYSLSNINANLANQSFSSLKRRITQVRKNAARYKKGFLNSKDINQLSIPNSSKPVFWAYMIRMSNSDELIKMLHSNNIEASKLHYPNHNYSAFSSTKINTSTLQSTNKFFKDLICLPCGWWLSDKDIDRTISLVKEN